MRRPSNAVMNARYFMFMAQKATRLAHLSRVRVQRAFLPPVRDPEHEAYDRALSAAVDAFHEGRFADKVRLILEAAELKQRARDRRGLAPSTPRLCGNEFVGAMGHLGAGVAMRRRSELLGQGAPPTIIVKSPECANTALVDYWRQHFPVVELPARSAHRLEIAEWPRVDGISWFESERGFEYFHAALSRLELEWEGADRGPLLQVSEKHYELGKRLLQRHGIRSEQWYVVLHARQTTGGMLGGQGYGRNVEIHALEPAIREVTRQGGLVINLGPRPHEDPVPGLTYLDYRRRTDPWVDVFLLGSSRFMIGTQSGPSLVASTLGTPVLLTNMTGWGFFPYTAATLAIPKQVVLAGSGRRLTIAEMVDDNLAFLDARLPQNTRLGALNWLDSRPDLLVEGVRDMIAEDWKTQASGDQTKADLLHEQIAGYRGVRLTRAALAEFGL